MSRAALILCLLTLTGCFSSSLELEGPSGDALDQRAEVGPDDGTRPVDLGDEGPHPTDDGDLPDGDLPDGDLPDGDLPDGETDDAAQAITGQPTLVSAHLYLNATRLALRVSGRDEEGDAVGLRVRALNAQNERVPLGPVDPTSLDWTRLDGGGAFFDAVAYVNASDLDQIARMEVWVFDDAGNRSASVFISPEPTPEVEVGTACDASALWARCPAGTQCVGRCVAEAAECSGSSASMGGAGEISLSLLDGDAEVTCAASTAHAYIRLVPSRTGRHRFSVSPPRPIALRGGCEVLTSEIACAPAGVLEAELGAGVPVFVVLGGAMGVATVTVETATNPTILSGEAYLNPTLSRVGLRLTAEDLEGDISQLDLSLKNAQGQDILIGGQQVVTVQPRVDPSGGAFTLTAVLNVPSTAVASISVRLRDRTALESDWQSVPVAMTPWAANGQVCEPEEVFVRCEGHTGCTQTGNTFLCLRLPPVVDDARFVLDPTAALLGGELSGRSFGATTFTLSLLDNGNQPLAYASPLIQANLPAVSDLTGGFRAAIRTLPDGRVALNEAFAVRIQLDDADGYAQGASYTFPLETPTPLPLNASCNPWDFWQRCDRSRCGVDPTNALVCQALTAECPDTSRANSLTIDSDVAMTRSGQTTAPFGQAASCAAEGPTDVIRVVGLGANARLQVRVMAGSEVALVARTHCAFPDWDLELGCMRGLPALTINGTGEPIYLLVRTPQAQAYELSFSLL